MSTPGKSDKTRLIVVPVAVDSSDRVLLCRMAPHRGVFPGQWALPGGGVEPGERIEDALVREIREELGVGVKSFRPLFFKDAVLTKTYEDGSVAPLHMVFLIYQCVLTSTELTINEEFSEYAWMEPSRIGAMDLNTLTRDTLESAGVLTNDQASIAAAIDRFIAAYNRSDLEGLLALYSEDLVKIRFRCEPETKRQTADRLRSFFETNSGSLTVRNEEIIVHGNVAFTRGTFEVRVTPKSGGEAARIVRRYVELWRKETGVWRVMRTMDAEP